MCKMPAFVLILRCGVGKFKDGHKSIDLWMLDLRCHPVGIFAVADTILILDVRYWMMKIYPLRKGSRRQADPRQLAGRLPTGGD